MKKSAYFFLHVAFFGAKKVPQNTMYTNGIRICYIYTCIHSHSVQKSCWEVVEIQLIAKTCNVIIWRGRLKNSLQISRALLRHLYIAFCARYKNLFRRWSWQFLPDKRIKIIGRHNGKLNHNRRFEGEKTRGRPRTVLFDWMPKGDYVVEGDSVANGIIGRTNLPTQHVREPKKTELRMPSLHQTTFLSQNSWCHPYVNIMV